MFFLSFLLFFFFSKRRFMDGLAESIAGSPSLAHPAGEDAGVVVLVHGAKGGHEPAATDRGKAEVVPKEKAIAENRAGFHVEGTVGQAYFIATVGGVGCRRAGSRVTLHQPAIGGQ